MVFIKKHMLKIGLFLILLSAGFLCIHSIWNYNGNTSQTQSRTNPRNSFSNEGNQFHNIPNQGSKGQFPDSNARQRMGSPNGRMWGEISSAGAKYAPQLITYAILFLVLFILVYYFLTTKKVKISPGNASILILSLLGIGLLLRISAATLMEGHPYDITTFKSWATAAANNLFQVYASSRSSDYPPLYMYILFLIGKIAGIPAMNPYSVLLLKLPSIAADIAVSYLIYRLAAKYLSLEISIMVSAFYIFNPAIFINSTFWGQVDSFFTLFVVSSIFLLSENKIGLSSAMFTAAVLMKPQGIIFLPVLFFELVRQKRLKSFLKVLVFSLSTAIIIILPFSLNKDAMWIFNLFSNTLGEYPYASVNAFNFFGLLGANYTDDASTLLVLSYHSWGMIFIVMITAFSWFIYIKGNSRVFASAAALLQIAGVFTLSARMHERYLFPAVALSILAFIYLKDKRLLLLAAGFSTTVYINTHFVLFETINGMNSITYSPALIFTSLLNVLLLFFLIKIAWDWRKKHPIAQYLH